MLGIDSGHRKSTFGGEPKTLTQAQYQLIREEALIEAQEAKLDPAAFMQFAMRNVEEGNASIVAARHQIVLLDFIQSHKRSAVMLPIDHTKTFSAATLALHTLGRDPSKRGAIISATQAQAEKPVGMVRANIEENPLVQVVFPALRKTLRSHEPWTQNKITVDREFGIRDASLSAVGYEGALDGSRLNFAIVDDLLNSVNTATKEQRDKLREWFAKTVERRIDRRNGWITVLNTPWQTDDLVHYLAGLTQDSAGIVRPWPFLRMSITGEIEIRNTTWDSDLLEPASDRPGDPMCKLVGSTIGEPLFPERYTPEIITDLRETSLPQVFDQLYECKARNDMTALCKEEWINRCLSDAEKLGWDRCARTDEEAMSMGVVAIWHGVDLAVKKGTGRDFTALVTIGALRSGQSVLLDGDMGQYDGPTIVSKIKARYQRFGGVFMVEDNGAQAFIRQFVIDDDASIPIKPHYTGSNKWDPAYGVTSIFVQMSNGGWLLPNTRGKEREPIVKSFVDACLAFNPAKHTPDILMAAWFASAQARKEGHGRKRKNVRSRGPLQTLITAR